MPNPSICAQVRPPVLVASRSGARGPHVVSLAVLLSASLFAGCTADLSADSASPAHATPERISSTGYPMDDVLRVNDLQTKGTHNSYHVMTLPIPPWHYTEQPLTTQLDSEGVRALELDIHYNGIRGEFQVYHVPLVDMGSTCWYFSDCLEEIKAWSDANPGHHPLFIQIEPKEFGAPIPATTYVDMIDEEILSVFPAGDIITPDSVQGSASSLPAAIESTGWPTLGATRGKVLFFMDNSEDYRDAYTSGGASLRDRVMFVDSDVGDAFAGVMILNDPIQDGDLITEAVQRGYIVRTRADSDTQEARDNDYTTLNFALNSGAQIVSTDFPAPVSWTQYWVDIPGGTPSRCNPQIAPADCTSKAIEDPALLKP